jgi:type I restriction enzyme M protein
MTNKQLKNLKDRLWQGADQLRANSGLKSTEYATPILGLIFLRFAQSKYSQYKSKINAEYEKNKGSRAERPIHEIAIEKCGYYLPPEAMFDYLLNLPESENLAEKTKTAMEAIEEYTAELADTLPKDVYYSVNSEDDPLVLAKLFKVFKDIPTDVSLDIFGEIYEYFLGEFALAEGQGGGEFFTPSTVVRYMVEVLAPTAGSILDPACGSGGMFVQTAHYIAHHNAKGRDINLRAYGVEKTAATVKLAKMNLVLNNVRGTITEANSYYRDPYDSFERFDYVMANPPFNVDEVELDLVKSQPRFNTHGVPQNKTKKAKGDAKETVPNANYLWINQFATALNKNGRAALVMANSASDAGYSEKDIRIKLIESGVISQMVTLPTNMFTSVTLPATLWFFNNAKPKEDEILFIDARNIFTQIDRAHRKFSNEQVKNLAIITRLYEGKSDEFRALVEEYKTALAAAPETSDDEDTPPKSYWQEQIDWLMSRFPDGKYVDVMCYIVKGN